MRAIVLVHCDCLQKRKDRNAPGIAAFLFIGTGW